MMVLLLLAALIPQQVLIATPRGQVSIPVANETGARGGASRATTGRLTIARGGGLTIPPAFTPRTLC